jgi:hypothetical protein
LNGSGQSQASKALFHPPQKRMRPPETLGF